MFANLFSSSRRPASEYERSFVQEVTVKAPSPRNRRLERLIVLGWIVIVLKSIVVVWAVRHYRIPFNPLWVIAPTVAFAILITWVYWKRS
jgi:hypothetical protein